MNERRINPGEYALQQRARRQQALQAQAGEAVREYTRRDRWARLQNGKWQPFFLNSTNVVSTNAWISARISARRGGNWETRS
jgi:hypothetical protein